MNKYVILPVKDYKNLPVELIQLNYILTIQLKTCSCGKLLTETAFSCQRCCFYKCCTKECFVKTFRLLVLL